MPILEYFWLVFGIMLYVKDTLCSYTAAASEPALLSDILLHQSYTSRQKRPVRTNDRVTTWDSIISGECCPSVTKAIAPLGGISKDGRLLQLFRDQHTIQKFYETECKSDIKDRACNFVDDTKWISKCRQKYTYTYAIVKDFNVTEPYRIDYMRIKSGCACTVLGPVKLTNTNLAEEILTELTAEILDGNKKK